MNYLDLEWYLSHACYWYILWWRALGVREIILPHGIWIYDAMLRNTAWHERDAYFYARF